MGKLGFMTGSSSLKKNPYLFEAWVLTSFVVQMQSYPRSMQSCLKQRAVINLFKSHSLRWLCANKGDNEYLGMNSGFFFFSSGNKLCRGSSGAFY